VRAAAAIESGADLGAIRRDAAADRLVQLIPDAWSSPPMMRASTECGGMLSASVASCC
jgi:hypothetical protein